MSSDIARRVSGTPIRREVRQAVTTGLQGGIISTKARVGEFAVNEVVCRKSMQRAAEQWNPDAADAVALIIGTTINAMAREYGQAWAQPVTGLLSSLLLASVMGPAIGLVWAWGRLERLSAQQRIGQAARKTESKIRRRRLQAELDVSNVYAPREEPEAWR